MSMAQNQFESDKKFNIGTHLNLGRAETYAQEVALDLIKEIDLQTILELDKIFDGSDERLPVVLFSKLVADQKENGLPEEKICSNIAEYLVSSAISCQPKVGAVTISRIREALGEEKTKDFCDEIREYRNAIQQVDAEAWERGLYRDIEDGSLDTAQGRIVDIGRKEAKTVIAAYSLISNLDEDDRIVIDNVAIDLLDAAFNGLKRHVTHYDFEAFVAEQQEAGAPNEEVARKIVQTLMNQFASKSSPVAHNSAATIGDLCDVASEKKPYVEELTKNAKDFIKALMYSTDARQHLGYEGIEDADTIFNKTFGIQ